ncbi:MAG TPA: leucyl/phenylalanyl-tRNA--protein transferase [Flavobacteriales bacterium]|nr:leucyl/phenylalanyl-tRNA--protein transferase [Flavobacteriales bacterium]
MSRPPQQPGIPVPVLLEAYGLGRFPMCHEDGELYWHDPDPRAVFPLDKILPNPRLQRVIRSGRFTVTRDTAFKEVVRACAHREETWIDPRIIASFDALHAAGHAHSIETWSDGRLVGGIYGMALRGAFFGESMFSRVSNAGKVAFYGLARHLNERGYVLFDSQYINPFTAQLGAVEIPKRSFRVHLAKALALDIKF